MSQQLRERLFAALDELVLVDPHTHIDPSQPASTTLADILGYHYYTELAHSAVMSRNYIEAPGLDPKEPRPPRRWRHPPGSNRCALPAGWKPCF